MEVLLKKTKITNAILKQALRSTEIDFKVGEILGWCLFSRLKYLVCYRSDTNGLSIYPMFKDVTVEERYKDSADNKNYLVEVSLGGNYIPIKYSCKTEEEKNDFVHLLKRVKHAGEVRGQFFT